MISRVKKTEIRALAREKLQEHEWMRLPVRPREFAETKLGILVKEFDPPEPSISGFLMQYGNAFGIGVSRAIKSVGFQNFTIAHELGHYFIEDHPMAVLKNGQHLSHSGYISKDRFEEEADAFATEFLMPWKLIESLLKEKNRGFPAIKNLADQCESSLVASAIRYTEVTKEQVAVVVSYRGKVEFMAASEPFREIHGIEWLRRGDSIPSGAPSMRFSSNGGWLNECAVSEEGSYLSDWFPSANHVEVEEDVVGLGSYQRLLTVLFAECEVEEDGEDESDADDYIDRWKEGRFRSRK